MSVYKTKTKITTLDISYLNDKRAYTPPPPPPPPPPLSLPLKGLDIRNISITIQVECYKNIRHRQALSV